MYNRQKKLLRLAAVLVCAGCAMSACGETAEAGTENTAAVSGNETETEAVTAEYTDPGVDYGGETFTFIDYDPASWNWIAGSYSDIHAEEESGDPLNDAQYRRNRAAEDTLNVRLATLPAGNGEGNTAMLNRLIAAADPSADAAFLFLSNTASMLSDAGKLVDLLSIDTLDTTASWWNQNANSEFTLGGQLKVLTGDLSIYTTFSPIMVFFNKTVAESFDIGDLYGMVRAGTWTYDEMIAMCKTVSSDLDGDGKMDENDRFGLAEQVGLINDILLSGGVRFSSRAKDGELSFTLNSERTASVIDSLVPFLNDDSLCCIAGKYSSKYSNVFRQLHIPMFMSNQLLFNMNQLLITFELRSMEADFGILPCPKFDEAQDSYHTPLSSAWATVVCVPTMNDRLDMTGHVLDTLGYYSQQYVTPAFIDTTVTNKAIRDEDSAEMLDLIHSSIVYDIAPLYNWGNCLSVSSGLAERNSTDFASAYAKSESAILKDMEKTMEFLKNQ